MSIENKDELEEGEVKRSDLPGLVVVTFGETAQ
jgi:hypothetical protein